MSSGDQVKDEPFDNILNYRDVGQFINKVSKTTRLKTGLLFRSARPDEASTADRARLLSLNITTVIDLRSKTEHIQQASKHSARLSSNALTSPNIESAATPVKIPGLTYAEINLNGSSFSMALMRRLPLSSSARLIGLMALGYRTQAISILGSQVMAPAGLIGLAIDSLLHSTGEIRAIFNILSNPVSYPVLVHCTQGKDRTGLTVLLVLVLCGVRQQDIKADYVLSEKELEPEREEKLAEIRSIGLPDTFADCPDDWVERVVEYINADLGGAERYFELRCGVSKTMQQNIKRTLLVNPE